jgi:hypothetical protein
MIKLSLKPDGVWFNGDHPIFDQTEIGSFDIEDRKVLSFFIAPVHPDELDALRKKHTTVTHQTTFINRQRVSAPVEQLDADKLFEDTIDRIVKNWKGFGDENGNEHPCDRDTKIAVARAYSSLASAWIICSRDTQAEIDRQQRESEKNLPTSPKDISGE